MKRVIVTGGRDFNDPVPVRALVQAAAAVLGAERVVVVHGGARGADLLGALAARQLGFPTEVFRANWDALLRAAGPVRNREMLEAGVDLVVALPGGTGTNDMVDIAKNAGVPILRYELPPRQLTLED